MEKLSIVSIALLALLVPARGFHAAESETFTGTAARTGTFKRPLLDVGGKRYELKASEKADEIVTELLRKFSDGDTGRYVIEGARATVNGKDGIVVDRISPAANPLPGARPAATGANTKPDDVSPAARTEPGVTSATVGDGASVTIVRSFPGNTGPGWKASIDVAGAVGPRHVVDFDVANFVVHDKTSGEILRRVSTQDFWKQVEPVGSLVPNRVANDARMLYDPLSKRWFACAAGAPEADCFLAVSTSPDPTEPWRGTKLPLPRINPYMKMGVDRNGLYVSSCNGGPDPRQAMNCYVIPKSDAIAPGGPVLTHASNFPALQFSSMPATDFDPRKTPDAPTVLLTNEFDGICDRLYLYRITWSGLKASLSDLQIVPLKNAYQTPNNSSGLMEAVQPAPGPNLHAGGGGRRLDSVVVYKGSVFGCNGAKRSEDSRPGVLWYELRISDGKLLQEGFVDSPDRDYIYPSIAVDSHGNIGIGCTGTSKTEFPSVYVMMHGAKDPAGSMREPVRAVPGTTAYHYAGQRAVNWSHYSATCIDPSDPDLLWTLQGYGNSEVDREWCTAWAAFRLSEQPQRSAAPAGTSIYRPVPRLGETRGVRRSAEAREDHLSPGPAHRDETDTRLPCILRPRHGLRGDGALFRPGVGDRAENTGSITAGDAVQHHLVPLFLGIIMLSGAVAAPPAKHPNLLLNRDEIEQVKAKIAKYPWAAAALEKTKEHALNGRPDGNNFVSQALYYTFTGDKSFADRARAELLGSARSELPQFRKLDMAKNREFGSWSPWGARAWTYDLIYETCSDAERAQIEEWFRVSSRVLMKTCEQWTTTPNLMFGKHVNIGLVGYCLGDREIIDWALNDPGAFGPHVGGFYPVMDTMVKDGRFWAEAPIYALVYCVPNMLALAEAARHYDGTDLYTWVSKKSGAGIKSLIDGYLLMGYPLERTGIGRGRVRLATFGDGGTSYNPSGTMGKDPEDLTNPHYLTVLELAYARYKDPGYAWMLSLPPDRNTPGWVGRTPFGYPALSHGEPLPEKPPPPPAPGGVYASQGFAMIRADESPTYWTNGSLAAMVTLGKALGHGHNDHYQLVLHGKGRLLYPDLNVIQYEPTYLSWTREGIGHSTLLVDHQSPASADFTTSHDFSPEVKFFALTGGAFKNIRQTRRLLMTKEYVVDVFHAADQQGLPRTFDWTLHGLGRLYPGRPMAYRHTNALVPYYWWVINERGRTVDETFQMDWIQRTAGFSEGRQFGPEWFQHEVGSRTTVLGVPETDVYYGDGPITSGPPYCFLDGNPEPACPVAVVRRQAKAATFAAVHEPYEGAPSIEQVQRLAEDDGAIALLVKAPGYTDYLCVGFDDREHTLVAGGETFAFTEYAYLRAQGGMLTARGKLRGFEVPAAQGRNGVLLNGSPINARRDGEALVYGAAPTSAPGATQRAEDDPRERSAALHYWWLPEEVHLSAFKERDTREVEVHLRSVGAGQAAGRLAIAAPQGLAVDPPAIDIPESGAGEERIVKLSVHTTTELPKGLYPLRFVPAEGTPAAPQTLTASVGVVMTVDRRVPLSPQYVVRAPGYTINVDGYSGVSYYILDADGHRRHGRMYGLNFHWGIPGVEGASRWRTPAAFIWQGEDNLTIGADPVRLYYKFYEDRMVFAVTPPTDPTRTWTMWMGTFEGLGAPIHTGKQEQPWLPITADWLFFPHPVYRQGILLTPPPEAPVKYALGGPDCDAVNFPIKTGQEVSLQFMTQAEVDALRRSGKLVPGRSSSR